MMKHHTRLTILACSLSLIACGVPVTQTQSQPIADNRLGSSRQPSARQQPGQTNAQIDYQFALLRAPHFKIQTYLDSVQGVGKLTLINGMVNPVDLTKPANLNKDEYFPLLTSLSKPGEFEVSPHPTKVHTLNIKPLKLGAKATLSIIAGNEQAVIELESPTINPSETRYLNELKDKTKLTLISGQVNTINLTAAENLKPDEYFPLLFQLSKENEFEVKPHPINASQITIKPLKPDAKATLTLMAGTEQVVLDLDTIESKKLVLGDNLSLVIPENLTMNKDEFREISVDGIAQGQFVFIGFQNTNPEGFSVENPEEKPNVLRVKALQSGVTTNVTVVVAQTTRTLTFTSTSTVQKPLEPIMAIQSPRSGTVFNSNEDVRLVAKLDNPVVGKCEVLFKDDTGNLLTTSPIASESNAQQVTHLWAAKDRSPVLEKAKFQAVYTCNEPPKEVKSEFVEVSFNPKVVPKTPLPLTVKTTPVTGQEFTQILLEFAPLPDIRDYKVYADERLLGSVSTQLTDTMASYRAEGLNSGKTYVFKVEALINNQVTTFATVNGSTWQSSASGGGVSAPSNPMVSAPAVAGLAITSLTPTSGATGSTVTIAGTGFDATPANNTVKFGSTTATVTAASSTSLSVTVPGGLFGTTQNVTVTVGGQTNSGTNLYSVKGVNTIAGNTSGYTDGLGTAARFNAPSQIARDSAGNLYVADQNNHQIRKIDTAGNVTSFAGSTTSGYSDGVGSAAKFRFPNGMAFDSSGNLYVADGSNHRIRKIATDQTVTTVAGNASGSANGIGTAAQFNGPCGLTIDNAGNLYVSEIFNHRIRKIATDLTVTTVAGSTSGYSDGLGTAAKLNTPYGVVVDTAGNLYVVDNVNNRIRKIDTASNVTTFAGSAAGLADGIGTAAQFSSPSALTIDNVGNLYVSDYNNNAIRKIDTGGTVTTITGSFGYSDGALSAAKFNSIWGLAIDSAGSLYLADQGNNRIRKIVP